MALEVQELVSSRRTWQPTGGDLGGSPPPDLAIGDVSWGNGAQVASGGLSPLMRRWLRVQGALASSQHASLEQYQT